MFLLSTLAGGFSGFILGYLSVQSLAVFGAAAFVLIVGLAVLFRYKVPRHFRESFVIVVTTWFFIGGFLGLVTGAAIITS